MTTTVLAVVQAAPELAASLDRIALAQIIMAVTLAVLVLLIIGGGLFFNVMARQLFRLLKRVESLGDQLAPRAEPLLERAVAITTHLSEITESLRRDADEVHETVEYINRKVRNGADDVERRARRLAAVLESVQEEAEALLIETAATAHGVQSAARALRETPDEDAPPRRRSAGD